MLRHLKNANELILYASISCGVAFIGRLFPAFYFPILLLRLGIAGYCVYVIAGTEGNKELAIILGGALVLGLLGGYWDLIEIYLRFDFVKVVSTSMLITCFFMSLAAMFIHLKNNGKTSQR